ncbi:MAG TPA: hypothetical protein VHC19_19360 [Pirellulales bacterium]|nr:hypothetical protein [Pirellulales bacterium]
MGYSMAGDFDPYYKWLGIPQKDQPPHHYRLLSVETFEDDPEVIESAADRQMAHVRTFQSGQYSALSQKLLNELAAAKLCLLTPEQKARYDQALRAQLGEAPPGAPRAVAVQRPMLEVPIDGGTSVILPARPAPQPPGANLVLKAIPLPPAVSQQMALGPALPLRSAYRRTTPLWRQPLALAGGAAGLLISLTVIMLLISTRRAPVIAEAPGTAQSAETAETAGASETGALGGTLMEASGSVIADHAAPQAPVQNAPALETSAAPGPVVAPSQIEPSPVAAASASKPLPASADSSGAAPAPDVMPAAPAPGSARSQPPVAAGESLDLLKQIDLDYHTVSGSLEWVDGALTGVGPKPGGRRQANGNYQVQVPFHPGDHEYLLTMVIEPVTPLPALNLGCISCGRQFLVVFFNGRCYLSQLDGRHLNPEINWLKEIFTGGKAATLKFAVGRNDLLVSVDGKPVVHWTEYNRLGRQNEWNGPDTQGLSIGWNFGNIRILKLEASPLRGDVDPGWLAAAVASPPKPVPVESIDVATAIQELEKRGGRLYRNSGAPGNPVISANLYNGAATNDLIPYVAAIPTLRRVSFSNSRQFTGRGLNVLARLQLESIDFGGTSLRPANVAPLGQMKGLTSLNLSRTPIDDEVLAELRSLEQLKQLYVSGTDVTDAGMEHVAAFRSLDMLDLSDTAVGNLGLERLKALGQLRHFSLSRTNITDAGLAALEAMPELQSLELPETLDGSGLNSLRRAAKLQRVTLGGQRLKGDALAAFAGATSLNSLRIQTAPLTDDALAPLAGVRQLRDLSLQRTNVTGTGLRHLNRLTELRSLTLNGKQVTDESITPAATLVRLDNLTLNDTSVTGAGLARLGRLQELTTLNLGGSPIDDTVLARLKGLKKLRYLYLYNTNVTDAGLAHLKALPELQQVNLGGTKTTEAGVEALRKALPKANVSR